LGAKNEVTSARTREMAMATLYFAFHIYFEELMMLANEHVRGLSSLICSKAMGNF